MCTCSGGHKSLGCRAVLPPLLREQIPAPVWHLLAPGRAWRSQPSCLAYLQAQQLRNETAGSWLRGAAQGGHQKASLTANFPKSPSLDAILRILKFFLIKCHCLLISFKEWHLAATQIFQPGLLRTKRWFFSWLEDLGTKDLLFWQLILFQESIGLSVRHSCFCISASLSSWNWFRNVNYLARPFRGKELPECQSSLCVGMSKVGNHYAVSLHARLFSKKVFSANNAIKLL